MGPYSKTCLIHPQRRKTWTEYHLGKLKIVQYTNVRYPLKKYVLTIGELNVGIKSDYISTHSNWSTISMWVYLRWIPTFTIMLLVWWKSDTFVLCLWEQVQNFSKGLSEEILQVGDCYTIPMSPVTNNCPGTRNVNIFVSKLHCGRNAVKAPMVL